MKFITQLSKQEQRCLKKDINHNLFVNVQAICMIADKYKVDRNELFDLYNRLLKTYLEKHDVNKQKTLNVEDGMKLLKAFLSFKEAKDKKGTEQE